MMARSGKAAEIPAETQSPKDQQHSGLSSQTPPPPPQYTYSPPPWTPSLSTQYASNYPQWPPNTSTPSTSNPPPPSYTQTSNLNQTQTTNHNYTQTTNPTYQTETHWAPPPTPHWQPPNQNPTWNQPYYTPRYRMDLPKFNGEDFKNWFPKFQQYVEMEHVPDDYKPKVAMFCFEGPALDWHQFYVNTVGGATNVRWEAYLFALRERFAFDEFVDQLFDLVRVKHTGTVRAYYDNFMARLNLAGIREAQALSIFLGNLKDEILGQLRLHKPRTLVQAAEMSMMIEANLESNKKSVSYTKTTATQITTIPPSRPTLPKSTLPPLITGPQSTNTTNNNSASPRNSNKKPTPAEIEERKKGLCFWCQAKYTSGHKCLRSTVSQLYNMIVSNEEDEGQHEFTVDEEVRWHSTWSNSNSPN
ncbi:hypothetical protein COLO4_04709 [Corchorus olitorius]|uniref:Ty3 transposon capsid-like protein domain-containing protein n=1 Tax=Corchorus olitorius TaxID=93759 RepID=A0A1R3KT11_9ROSI|nr:hypothetical protein COLO4_04709 [Corchorus olitorius]